MPYNLDRHQFTAALQTALTRDEVARAYLGHVTAVVEADGFGLYELNPEQGGVIAVNATVQGAFLEDYETYGRADDPVLRFVTTERLPIDSSRACSSSAWRGCGAGVALRSAGFTHSMEAPVVIGDEVIGTINFARSADRGKFDTRDLSMAQMVSEQLALATQRARRYERAARKAAAIEGALDRLPQGVVVTELDGQTLFRNRAAALEWGIDAAAPESTASLSACIREAAQVFRSQSRRVVTRPLETLGRRGVVKSYRLSDTNKTAVTVVYATQTQTDRHLPQWDVLTRREQEIAELVSEGLTTKEIAKRAFISENTVKLHLKRVFAKTDVSNRAELVQVIWSSGREGT